MKVRLLAAAALFGVALSPAFAHAAEGCLGSETITKFKSLGNKTLVLTNSAGEDYKVEVAERVGNMSITQKIKTRSDGECLVKGDSLTMSGMGGHQAKYKVVSIEPVSGAQSAAVPSN